MRGHLLRLVAVLAIQFPACDGGGRPTPDPTPDDGGPYVVTAVDYHFHDAHPSKPLALDRGLEFSNQGNNVHNVTIPGTGYERNLRTGDRIRVEPIASLVDGPGRYPFFCKFHEDRGMTGVLVVVGA